MKTLPFDTRGRALAAALCAATSLAAGNAAQAQLTPSAGLGAGIGGGLNQTPNAGAVLNQVTPRENRPAEPPPPGALPALPASGAQAASSAEASTVTVDLRGVRIVGNDSIPEPELAALAQDHIGKPATLAELNDIALRMTALYRRRGYALAQVIVPPQDATSGVVTFSVIEGRLERIEVNMAPGTRLSEARVRARLASLETGRALRQQDLERAMLLLSDVPGIKVGSAIEPGNEPGSVILDVDVAPARRSDFAISGDNYGAPTTGSGRLGMIARLNSPFGIGDNLDLRLLGTQRLDTMYGRIGYDAPINAYGTRLGVGYAHLYYNVGQEFSALGAHGEADVVDLAVSHPLIRTRNQTLLLRGGVEYRNLVDKIGALSLDTPKSLTDVNAGLSWESRDALLGGGFNSASASIVLGTLNIRSGEAKALDQSPVGRHTQGTNLHAVFSANRLNRVTDHFNVFVGISGQWANSNLDNSSRLLLGGPQAVRAYSPDEALVDEGFIATVEGRYAITPSFTVLAFYDLGKGWYNANKIPGQTNNSITRSGAGIGAFWAAPGGFTVQGTLAWRTSSPDTTGNDHRPRVYVQVTKAF
ncbi:hypothetical protein BTHE68_56680 [Burkholderia sp. THE68]|uniref:ShlB/FhaC/HecB family hemolysin secretion/activation protein n=1 Tax=Burkholderia sp. THE68 TaxID=758782 RepID=UPI001316A328|nr:ShlB/FhaC/HecB family hemolysin secretion/activation protein [Burkholderia sp. THE68]BBU31934.1 hypothetical protein BTHE68_56680 [Burkholderia sp. THE68]